MKGEGIPERRAWHLGHFQIQKMQLRDWETFLTMFEGGGKHSSLGSAKVEITVNLNTFKLWRNIRGNCQ